MAPKSKPFLDRVRKVVLVPHPSHGRLVAGLADDDRRYPDGRVKLFAALVTATTLLMAVALLPDAGITLMLLVALVVVTVAVISAFNLYDGVRDKAAIFWAAAGVFVYMSLCFEIVVTDLPIGFGALLGGLFQMLGLAIGVCAGLMERRQGEAVDRARRELRLTGGLTKS